MNFEIDNTPPEYDGLRSVNLEDADVEITNEPVWGAPQPDPAVISANTKRHWKDNPERRAAQSKRMSEQRRSGKVKPKYTPERNAKIAAYHERRRAEKAAAEAAKDV